MEIKRLSCLVLFLAIGSTILGHNTKKIDRKSLVQRHHITDAGISGQLLASLNPVTVFRFDISEKVLTNKVKWRIS